MLYEVITKGFLIRLLSYWKWFLLSLIITFLVAYNVNIRKPKVYGLESLIVIKDENNSFFTSNTSLVFNWGGVSEKVQTIITTLKSRSHNELVVDKLQYYIQYLKKGKYYFEDVYGATPFKVAIDKNKGQLTLAPIKIKFLSPTEFQLSVDFKENGSRTLIHYVDNSRSKFSFGEVEFSKKFKVGENINLPFLHLRLYILPEAGQYVGKEYFIRFDDFNNTVARYKGIDVNADVITSYSIHYTKLYEYFYQ